MMLLQEGSTVSWDPASCWDCYGYGTFSGELIAWALPRCFAIYLCWLPIQWLVGRGWRATRYVLPTLALIAALAAPAYLIIPSGIIGANLASLALEGVAPPAWMIAVLAAILGWVSWYIAVLCMELRAEAAPVKLDLFRL
jgi:hypothetical protein